jgi:hypothetical protein
MLQTEIFGNIKLNILKMCLLVCSLLWMDIFPLEIYSV